MKQVHGFFLSLSVFLYRVTLLPGPVLVLQVRSPLGLPSILSYD